MCRRLAALLPALLLAVPANAQVPPEKALETMTVADGLQIELFAAKGLPLLADLRGPARTPADESQGVNPS